MREYAVIYDTPSGNTKTTHKTLCSALKEMVNYLHNINGIDLAEKGFFVTTQNTFNKDFLVKRYRVSVGIPPTIITVKKLTKGSLNSEKVIELISHIKGKYYARN